jgi:hypothetical protein
MRVMGRSVMVPLNCAAFIAVTGNGLSVSEDLARRFLEVVLDPQCEGPESRPFPKGFLDKILTRRTELLASVLTIWRWGRQNAVNLTRGLPLGSFETWAEWVRDPLLTLGCQDPVEQVSAAKANDPRRRRVAELFATWWGASSGTANEGCHAGGPSPHHNRPAGSRTPIRGNASCAIGGHASSWFRPDSAAPAGKWTAATYRIEQTESDATEGMGYRTHRGHRDGEAASGSAIPPMGPMPCAGDDVGETEGEL